MKTAKISSVKSVVMRRVWYSYIISLLSNYATVLGFLFGAGVVMLVNLTSVSAILNNLLAVQLGQLPHYVWQTLVNAFKGGEFLTLLSLAIVIYSLLSLRFYVRGHGHVTTSYA